MLKNYNALDSFGRLMYKDLNSVLNDNNHRTPEITKRAYTFRFGWASCFAYAMDVIRSKMAGVPISENDLKFAHVMFH